jgi:hypothetical protein
VIARSRHGIDHIAIAPGGARVALASNFTQIVDLKAGGSVGELRTHVDGTYDVAFDPTGTRLATCSTDRTIAIADVRPMREREFARAAALRGRNHVPDALAAEETVAGRTRADSFATWRAVPRSELMRRSRLQAEWIEYWIQHGPALAR